MTRLRHEEPASFGGFGPHLVDFFDQLADHNDRAWFKSHKQQYDTQVAGPLRSLAATLEPEFGAIKVYRPYRDIRFSPDKRPIQEHAALSATDGRAYGYYLQVSAAGLLLGGGLYQPPRERLERFRAMLDDPVSAGEVRRRLGEAERAGFELSDDGKLKAAPRGFSRDHPEIGLLRHTQLALVATYEPAAWLSGAACYDRIRDGWANLRAWNEWLAGHNI